MCMSSRHTAGWPLRIHCAERGGGLLLLLSCHAYSWAAQPVSVTAGWQHHVQYDAARGTGSTQAEALQSPSCCSQGFPFKQLTLLLSGLQGG